MSMNAIESRLHAADFSFYLLSYFHTLSQKTRARRVGYVGTLGVVGDTSTLNINSGFSPLLGCEDAFILRNTPFNSNPASYIPPFLRAIYI